MVSLSLARQLKKFGLEWHPDLHDFFVVPDRGLDDRHFVITDVMTYIEMFRGWPVVTFHGTAEWALDYVLQTEAVWLPTESQLREMLHERATDLSLTQEPDGYRCSVQFGEQNISYAAGEASDAYASVLLQILMQQSADAGTN